MSNKVNIEVRNFINRIVPIELQNETKTTAKGRILSNDIFTTPYKIITTDDFFKDFIVIK